MRTPGLCGVSGASPLRECYLQNLRIISEKNLTLQWLVSAAILSLVASLLTGYHKTCWFMKLVMIIKAEICSVLISQAVLFCLKSVNWPIKTICDLTRVIMQLIVHLKGLFTMFSLCYLILLNFHKSCYFMGKTNCVYNINTTCSHVWEYDSCNRFSARIWLL